jgi:hypothetical protein
VGWGEGVPHETTRHVDRAAHNPFGVMSYNMLRVGASPQQGSVLSNL